MQPGAAEKQQQKSFYSDGQYVQLIWVGHPPIIMVAFCRVQKKTFRDSYPSFRSRTLAVAKRECSVHSKSFFFQIFFLIAQTVSPGKDVLRAHKAIGNEQKKCIAACAAKDL